MATPFEELLAQDDKVVNPTSTKLSPYQELLGNEDGTLIKDRNEYIPLNEYDAEVLKDRTFKDDATDAVYYLNDLVRQAAQGATLGYSDEIAGFMDNLTGLGEGKNYTENRDIQRDLDEEFRESNPGSSFIAELLGSVGTGLNIGKGLKIGRQAPVTKARQILVDNPYKTAYGAGAGFGALYGAGQAEEIEDIPIQATFGGVLGAALAGIIPVTSAPAQRLIDRGVNTTLGETFGPISRYLEDFGARYNPFIKGNKGRSAQSLINTTERDVKKDLVDSTNKQLDELNEKYNALHKEKVKSDDFELYVDEDDIYRGMKADYDLKSQAVRKQGLENVKVDRGIIDRFLNKDFTNTPNSIAGQVPDSLEKFGLGDVKSKVGREIMEDVLATSNPSRRRSSGIGDIIPASLPILGAAASGVSINPLAAIALLAGPTVGASLRQGFTRPIAQQLKRTNQGTGSFIRDFINRLNEDK